MSLYDYAHDLVDDLMDYMPVTGPVDADKPVWPTVAEATDRLFGWFDTNLDGALTVAEIAAVIDRSEHRPQGLTDAVTKVVGLIDTNGDGALSRSEVTSAVAKLDTDGDGVLSPIDLVPHPAQTGLVPVLDLLLHFAPAAGNGGPKWPPEPLQPPRVPGVNDVVDVLMTRFDADHSGSLTLPELLAVIDPNAQHAKVDAALATLVSNVDTNHDGAMSRGEIVAAVGTLDSDHDDEISASDHVPGPPDDGSVDLIGLLLPHLRDFDVAMLAHFD